MPKRRRKKAACRCGRVKSGPRKGRCKKTCKRRRATGLGGLHRRRRRRRR